MKDARINQPSIGPNRLAPILFWPPAILLIALVMPSETSVFVGSLRLSPYRLVLLACFVPLLLRWLRGAGGGPCFIDLMVACHAIWAMLALMNYAGLGEGIESGGIYVLESCGCYLFGRLYIRSPFDFRLLTQVLTAIVACLVGFAVLESTTGQNVIRSITQALLGGSPLPFIEPRMGLRRAFTTFDHPILFGVFSAVAFSLVYLHIDRAGLVGMRTVKLALIGIATFCSLSVGAFVALAAQIAILGWDFVTRGLIYRWRLLFAGVSILWIATDILSNRSPLHVFISYLTFSAHSAYTRILIWEHGSAEALRHPVFGIGLGDWSRPDWMVSDSVDNFWLVIAMRYGLPAFLFLAAALLSIVWGIGQRHNLSADEQRARKAWMATLCGLFLAGCTVHFWNAVFCLFYFLLGAGVWLTRRASSSAVVARPMAFAR
jgi:hypothetical protein